MPPPLSSRRMGASRRRVTVADAHPDSAVSLETTMKVSEDSSSDEHEHFIAIKKRNSTTNKVRTNYKKRKSRRTSMSTLDQQYYNPSPSKMQRSFSYPGVTRLNTDADSAEDDHDRSTDDTASAAVVAAIARGGVLCPFPWKLHDMLDYCCPPQLDSDMNDHHQQQQQQKQQQQIVTWNDTGTAFAVLDTKLFLQTILPRFFAQSKYASFQRQLNLYGFVRESVPSFRYNYDGNCKAKNYSFYSHPHFIRGNRANVQLMVRCKIKGTGNKQKRIRTQEFYPSEEVDYDGEEEGKCDDDDDSLFQYPQPDDENIREEPIMMCNGPDNRVDEIASPIIEPSEEPSSEMHDGDLLFFDGSPFHFFSPQRSEVSISDTSVPEMFLPQVPVVPFQFGEDTRNESNHIRYYNFYRDPSVSKVDYSWITPQKQSNLMGVFDHHFYDAHPAGRMITYRYNDLPELKVPLMVTSNLPITSSASWSKCSPRNIYDTAI